MADAIAAPWEHNEPLWLDEEQARLLYGALVFFPAPTIRADIVKTELVHALKLCLSDHAQRKARLKEDLAAAEGPEQEPNSQHGGGGRLQGS